MQITARLTKPTLIKLEVIIAHTLAKGEIADRSKIARKLITEFVNNKENQVLVKRFKKNSPAKYKEIQDEVGLLKR